MTLIAIVGIDGSGKTTLTKAIVRELRSQGVPARYFEVAGGRPPLNRLATLFGHADAIDWLGRDRFEWFEQRVRHLLMARAVRYGRRTGRVAVTDRYAYCQYAAMRNRGSTGEGQAHARYASMPRPDLVVYLAVRPEVAQKRVEARGRDHETLEYLTGLDAAYRALPQWAEFSVVDANRAAEEVKADVVARIAALLRPGAAAYPAGNAS